MPHTPPDNPTPEAADEWFAPGLSFNCTQCGACCTGSPGYVWFDDDEAEAMAAELGMDKLAFLNKYASKKYGKWSLNENRQPDGKHDCVFLRWDEAGRSLCSIYQVRPTQCRTWPFWESNMRSKADWDESAAGCPGMGREGNFVSVEEIKRRLAENPSGL